LLLLLRVAPAEVGRAFAPELLLAGFGAAWSSKKKLKEVFLINTCKEVDM
jgi:hypothetical protein